MNRSERLEIVKKVVERPGVNEFDVLSAKECKCLFCGSVYSARSVRDWDKKGDSLCALCPVCGCGVLLCDNEGVDLHAKDSDGLPALLRKNFPEFEADAYRHYCGLYQDGALSQTKEHDALYVSYLSYLQAAENDAYASLSLARYYSKPGKFHDADLEAAIAYFRDPGLRANSSALFELGNCYAGRGKQGDKRLAFEAYSKSAALGSTRASICIAYAYLFGDYVKRDPEFGFECLLRIFDEVYPSAIRDPFPLEDFGKMAYALGSCFHAGYGTKQDNDRAMRYFLISILCAQTHAEQFREEPAFKYEKDATDHLEELCPPNRENQSSSIVFDADTFIDSFWDQCDDISKKEISNVHYEDGNLYFDLDCEVPMIVIDQGNGKIAGTPHMSWTFQNVTYKQEGESLKFEEIAFVGSDQIEFVHHDNGKPTVVFTIYFPVVEEK